MLHNCGLSCIIGYDTVTAVSDNPHGDPGDIVLILTSTNTAREGEHAQEHHIPVQQGITSLAILRRHLQDIFETPGNTHWATVTDARMLSEALDIGFCIFANGLQGNGTRCIVSLDGNRGNYAYFIAVWYLEPTHFRSMEIQCTTNDTFRTCWSAAELPMSIVDLYNEPNRTAPVFSTERAGSGVV